MSHVDFWYIRFPDGRILRAASTAILRHELGAGRIPIGSTVRRSPSDEWVSLEWTQEFADLVEQRLSAAALEPELRRRTPNNTSKVAGGPSDHPATVASRLDPGRLHHIGVRGCIEELLAALDSTLVPKKILLTLLAGLLMGGLLAIQWVSWFERDNRWLVPAWCVGGAALIGFAVIAGLLTRLTYVELSRLRPAHWAEGLSGLGALTVRLIVAEAIVGGAGAGLIVLLRWVPYWLSAGPEIAARAALALAIIVEVSLWPVFFFACLIPPILVVEGCSVGRGLRRWLAFLRLHLGRVFLYQAMAVGLGALVAVPLLLLIALVFAGSFHPPEELREVASGTRSVLLGLACAPLLSYWIVANVFIYLNLRYGASSRR